MDNIKNEDIYILAATNRPDLVDETLLRFGRFDKIVFTNIITDFNGKISLLKACTRKLNLTENFNFNKIIE